jgi:DNA-binding protein Fis
MKIECPFCNAPTRIDLPLTGEPLPELLDRIEKIIVEATLKRTYGNQTSAAKDLGMPKHALRHLIKKHGLK